MGNLSKGSDDGLPQEGKMKRRKGDKKCKWKFLRSCIIYTNLFFLVKEWRNSSLLLFTTTFTIHLLSHLAVLAKQLRR